MDDAAWRPLGVDTEDQIAEYDALHDGVPTWMSPAFWAWVRSALTVIKRYSDGSGRIRMLDTPLAEYMCQTLRIPLPNLRATSVGPDTGRKQLDTALAVLQKHQFPLQVADFLLAHGTNASAELLGEVLEHCKSAYEIGTRAGRPGLTRRVPLGVQVAADAIMDRAARAGVRLAKAWEAVYGVTANASEAYRLAILAVEDAAIPVVSPSNTRATLGTVIRQMEDQDNWRLPMEREHNRAPSKDVLLALLRMLWHGQHDRHGGQPSGPGNVSLTEAQVAVSVSVTLVQLFDASLVQQEPIGQ